MLDRRQQLREKRHRQRGRQALGALDPVEPGDKSPKRRGGGWVVDWPQAAVSDVPQAGLGDVS